LATPAPATPAPAQVKAAQEELKQEMSLKNIEFEVNSATIRPTSTTILDEVATTLKRVGGTPVEIGGHTDSSGNEAANIKLSQDRADSVKAYLVGKGIPAAQLTPKGFGPSKPVADNATPEGKQKNRRIEFTLKK
jgi:OmpA-OmpF porin, OOP family